MIDIYINKVDTLLDYIELLGNKGCTRQSINEKFNPNENEDITTSISNHLKYLHCTKQVRKIFTANTSTVTFWLYKSHLDNDASNSSESDFQLLNRSGPVQWYSYVAKPKSGLPDTAESEEEDPFEEKLEVASKISTTEIVPIARRKYKKRDGTTAKVVEDKKIETTPMDIFIKDILASKGDCDERIVMVALANEFAITNTMAKLRLDYILRYKTYLFRSDSNVLSTTESTEFKKIPPKVWGSRKSSKRVLNVTKDTLEANSIAQTLKDKKSASNINMYNNNEVLSKHTEKTEEESEVLDDGSQLEVHAQIVGEVRLLVSKGDSCIQIHTLADLRATYAACSLLIALKEEIEYKEEDKVMPNVN
jgi:hypothetical protein